jgi:hypothetical protein
VGLKGNPIDFFVSRFAPEYEVHGQPQMPVISRPSDLSLFQLGLGSWIQLISAVL